MPSVTFRNARHADLPTIIQLLANDAIAQSRTGYAEEVTPAVDAAFNEITADANNEIVVGELDGQVIATLQLTYIPGLGRGGIRRALVEEVRVRSDLRGQRIGEALMNEAMARARARGCALMQLTTDKRRHEAQRFYARLGFVASHEGMKLPL
ncbi:GNAT family N-acetyltransferase [Corallococcus sp. AB049A]|uniref:GNAT family N-acetyltransferase n=1 Tax=Corallococcus interemptor TaxID=2316720 RepID=A0A3A8QP08_9BACT|nr:MULTISPECIES: GNAT family N-acetyltransferase [Corallococcus]RKH40225.1 GNAT family N-acetyltransferase [Corallococcus sp. AB050B]RKH69548.1 GNAT family N-acetyltransferase [Corallococcus interemptor]RKI60535.1 GNAT family N-acetyltransferase [Corallococcus sp. AB049A]